MEYSTIRIALSDRRRLEARKVHPAQPVGEVVRQLLDDADSGHTGRDLGESVAKAAVSAT